MSHYKPYPVYKDSGVEWLGRVPEHWAVMRFRDICEGISTGPFGTALGNGDYVTGGVPVINPSHIVAEQCCPDEDISVSAETAERLRFWAMQAGDIVTARRGELGRSALITAEQDGWICGTGSLRVRPMPDRVNARHLHTILQSNYARDWLNLSSVGSTMANLNESILGQLPVACPGIAEQAAIATHLDRETARIDALVEKKTRFIELLREKRQALITHAVTKGLDPNVRMKDSGVEWLGVVPDHWEVSPIRYVVRPQAGAIKTGPFGSQLTASEMLGGGFKVYNQKNVIERDLSSGDNYISDEKYEQLSSFRVYPGDVLITTRGTIGRVCIAPDEIEPGILHPCLMRVQLDESKVGKEFFAALLGESHILQSQISYLSNASTIEVIYSETMGSLVVPIPPLAEQRSILVFIQAHTSKLDSLIFTTEQSIILLKERRSALITAAVTGQIDLREAV